jgi:2-keto-3-deoxy-L-rhamnonate aldolase RhmA
VRADFSAGALRKDSRLKDQGTTTSSQPEFAATSGPLDPATVVETPSANKTPRPVVHRSVPQNISRSANGDPTTTADVFLTASGQPRILRGICVYSGSTRLAELAAKVGFETIWIEMEHGPSGFSEVEALCMAIEAGGGIAAVRVPDGQRHHVLRALEVGARIVIVPMVNTPEQARQIVEFGKFPPIGSRGFNVRSRGVNYGIGDRHVLFAHANERTHLFAQIETKQAVENLDEICAVQGLCGIFIGPGDLSVSLNLAGNLDSEPMVRVVCDCVRRARAAGKHVGILVPPGKLLDAAVEAGCDLLYYGGDVTELSMAWPLLLNRVPAKVAQK